MDSSYRRLFAAIVFRSVAVPFRRVCVLFHFRAVPPRVCFVPFPRRPASSQLMEKTEAFVGGST